MNDARKSGLVTMLILSLVVALAGCSSRKANDGSSAPGATASAASAIDPDLAAHIEKIKAVDNHTHVNTTVTDDHESDALPLDEIFPFAIPSTLMPDHPGWAAAYEALYGVTEVNDAAMKGISEKVAQVRAQQGEKFPTWVLDKIGTEVMLANRVALGPGLAPPRFRWVPFDDALLFPLSTKNEQKVSPDRGKLYPHEEALLKRYMTDLKVTALPPNLEGYLKTVVTPTLEAQKKAGAVAIKFEAALLRSLQFDDVPAAAASAVYARYVHGGDPSRADYKQLQDYIFHHIAREAGRLGLVVHLHSFEGPGNFYQASGSDPLLMESVITDPRNKDTMFLFIHGGGAYASHAGALFWRPNVYVDMSAMAFMYPPERLSRILRDWLTQFPDRVLFGTDAASFGPETGWELSAWMGTSQARKALGIALTHMVASNEVSQEKAKEIATMVMRGNAAKLYKLELQ